MNDQEKINLINFFVRHKRLTYAQQARFASLVARDCGNIDVEIKKEEEMEALTISHSPKKMIEFLSLFSRDDRFKWFTHKWDMSIAFNIDEMIEKLRINRSVLYKMAYSGGPVINKNTYNQVWNFINFMNEGENIYTWKNTTFENIKYGWHSIVELSKENPNIPVENLKLDNGKQFKDYIRMFKGVIEFRTDLKDDYRFRNLVWKRITSELPKDFEVIFTTQFYEIGYDLNIYCDVMGLLTALNILCNWMRQHKSRSSKVTIDLSSEEEFYVLEIFHEGSYFNNKEKLVNPTGDFDKLRKRLFSVCDFSMEGDYVRDGQKDGSIIVNALDEGTKMEGEILTSCMIDDFKNEIGGLKYKFKIYKRQ